MEHLEELAVAIRQQWDSQCPEGEALAAPPSPAALRELLEVAFLASLKTEEARRIKFSLIFADPDSAELEMGPTHLSPEIHAAPFSSRRPFTPGELLRLAPATDHRQVFIAVCEERQTKALLVWGLLDAGSSWWRFNVHESKGGSPPPNALILRVNEPGSISAFRSEAPLGTLREGRVSDPAQDVLLEGPVAEFLYEGRDRFHTTVCSRLGRKTWDPRGRDESYPKRHFLNVLSRLLHRITQTGHGGALIIVPRRVSVSDSRLLDRASFKYVLRDDRLQSLSAKALELHRQFFDLHFRLWDAEAVKPGDFREYGSLKMHREAIDEAMTDALTFVSGLSNVDGAVVLNDDLVVLGFGAEVIASSHSMRTVRVAQDERVTQWTEVPIESFGTRHRSAFRFCSSYEDGLAFVASQDGGVKAVRRVEDQVVLWPNVLVGF